MKHVLLTALSFLLVSNVSVLAQQDDRAGTQRPLRFGAESRVRQQTTNLLAQARTSAGGQAPNKATGSATTDSTTKSSGKAFGGKGQIPPPPDVMITPGTKKRAKRKYAETSTGPTVAENKDVVVGTGGPYTFTGKAKEEFSNTFDWQPDDPGDKLTFTARFSPLIPASTPHLNWVRIMLGNQVLASERDLKGKSEFTLDLTRGVVPGVNQIVVSGQGTTASTFEWRLVTPRKVKLTAVNPDEVVVGQDLTLKGENFDPTPTKDTITLGKKEFPANTATPKELKLRIPKDFPPGEYLVKVTVDGLSSHEKKVIVRGIPELTGTNFNGIPPGAQLVIFGKNFSKKLAENQVTFAGTPAEVVACSPDQLTVVVPNFYTGLQGDTGGVAGQVGIPIKVKVGKVESINSVPINVGNSMWQDPGLKGGPDTPTVPVDWRRLLEN